MLMADDSMVRIMESLGLDYSSAINSTIKFEKTITDLQTQLIALKATAGQTAKDISASFSDELSRLKSSGIGINSKDMSQSKLILDQYGNALRTINDETAKHSATIKDVVKQSTLASMDATAAAIQQKTTAKGLSEEYKSQAALMRNQLAELQQKLQLEGKLSAEEIKQTAQLEEQLSVLKSQQRADVAGMANQPTNILGSEFQRRASWFMTGGLFYGTINAGKEAAKTISDVEMGVTEIARVMEDNTFVFKDYRDQLLKLGVDYGQTFANVQDIALRWAQAGYNVKDSLENTRTSLLALNTAELDASNATESLIGIMAQWSLTSKELPLVLDKINKTADDFTVTSQDLVDGLLRSSGAAKIMGLSIDQTISLLTILREASGRTGREVGNALNSILSYIQRPIAIQTLEKNGIVVFADKARTQFRNVMDIFQDVAAKWPSLSAEIQDGFVKAADDAGLFNEELASSIGTQKEWNDLQQRDLAQAAAGVYRRNYFIGMIERLTKAQEVLNNMTDAAGYSEQENVRTMDTLAKKYTSLQTAAQELAVALGDAGLLDIMKGLADIATSTADAFSNLDDDTKALVTTAMELLGIVAALKTTAGLFTTRNLIFGASSIAALIGPWGQLAAAIAATTAAVGLYAYNSYKASSQSIQDSVNAANAKEKEIDESNKLIKKYDELNGKTEQTNEVKAEMLDIQKQLAQIYPDYVDFIDAEGNKLVTNIPLVKEMNALRQQELELRKQELALEANTKIPQLLAQQEQLQQKIDINRRRLSTGDTYDIAGMGGGIHVVDNSKQLLEEQQKLAQELADTGKQLSIYQSIINGLDNTSHGGIGKSFSSATSNSNTSSAALPSAFTDESLKALYQANKISLQTYLNGLKKLVKDNYSEFVGKTSKELNDMLNNPVTAEKAKEYLELEKEIKSVTEQSNKAAKEKNEALEKALKSIDYQKQMSVETQESIKKEIAALKVLRDTYRMNADEQMDLDERIYNAEKALRDRRLQDSVNWINEQKELGKLSADDEIAAWERVLKNQKDNIEAVKEATTNLYKLRKQIVDETFSFEEDIIQHWAKLGVYSIQQQIDAYKELYSVKASSVADEYKRTENLFNLYKDLLSEQQKAVKDAYDERIQQIEDEATKRKKAQQDIISCIESEEKALDRLEGEHDYASEMADLREQVAYWSVRTSEDARQKVADLNKQIAEKEHDHDVELQKQTLEDKKQTAQDEIDAIEEAAQAEKEKWEASYKLIEKAFGEHSADIIALSGTMSKEAYQQWVDNYLTPLQNALKSGDLDSFTSNTDNLDSSIDDLNNSTANSTNAQIYRAASSILNLKRQYELGGDYSAAKQAVQYYNQLEQLGSKGLSVAEQLHAMNYEQAKNYIDSLPRAHTGAEVLTYGAAYLKPGELVFPPDLSTKLESLIQVLYARPVQQPQTSSYMTDKRVVINGPLFNSEQTVFEDDTDQGSFARELQRAIVKMT